MSDSPADDDKNTRDKDKPDLHEAAQEGKLPYVAEENQAAERGEERSNTANPEREADKRGEGDVVGGINMR